MVNFIFGKQESGIIQPCDCVVPGCTGYDLSGPESAICFVVLAGSFQLE